MGRAYFFAHAEKTFAYNGTAVFCRTLQRVGYFGIPVAFEVFNLEKAASQIEHRVYREKSACLWLTRRVSKRGQVPDLSCSL
jgi:hypothetical protein